jgi:RNA 2',3'-cyclic 3'-phosphodiesterase
MTALPPSRRLFIGLTLPAVHRDLLAGTREKFPGFSWTPHEQLHLTMRYIGEVDTNIVAALGEKLATVSVESFLLPVEGVGVFPQRGAPRVLWAGVGRGHPRLFQLRQRLDDALLTLPLEVDMRTFHPHVTLARLAPTADPKDIATWLKTHAAFGAPPWRVEGFTLFESDLRPSGAVHTPLQTVAFPS